MDMQHHSFGTGFSQIMQSMQNQGTSIKQTGKKNFARFYQAMESLQSEVSALNHDAQQNRRDTDNLSKCQNDTLSRLQVLEKEMGRLDPVTRENNLKFLGIRGERTGNDGALAQ